MRIDALRYYSGTRIENVDQIVMEEIRNTVATLEKKVLDGMPLNASEAMELTSLELECVCEAANRIRETCRGNGVDLCCIMNAKSGRCSEDCRYCAQSAAYRTTIDVYPLKSVESIVQAGRRAAQDGIGRFSVVTSGRKLSQTEIDLLARAFEILAADGNISLCASLGLQTTDELKTLKNAGLARFHHNLETSRRFFTSICTTHTYDDKIATILRARAAGLTICSGGIMGMGETWSDRIAMAIELRELDVRSIPINILTPISGTRMADRSILTIDEVRRIIAVWRFLLPNAAIRLAGGRKQYPDQGALFFASGADAAITGDMLTTSGVTVNEDRILLEQLGRYVASVPKSGNKSS
ncbi:MAG: biotin synthase BioB [Thermoguttaceae bacterium]|nr:biotin synthase BioB [Thermoguttaceae bacterium]